MKGERGDKGDGEVDGEREREERKVKRNRESSKGERDVDGERGRGVVEGGERVLELQTGRYTIVPA